MAAESSGETDNEAQLSRASSFTSLGESLLEVKHYGGAAPVFERALRVLAHAEGV